MATVTLPSPTLFAAFLHILGNADPFDSSISSTWRQLVEDLSAEEADVVPEVISGVLPLLRHDAARLRMAVEIAAAVDLYEVAPTVVELAAATHDADLLLSAATLSGNPAVPGAIRQRVRELGRLWPELARAIDIRSRPDAPATSLDEELLHQQRWPGSSSIAALLPSSSGSGYRRFDAGAGTVDANI